MAPDTDDEAARAAQRAAEEGRRAADEAQRARERGGQRGDEDVSADVGRGGEGTGTGEARG